LNMREIINQGDVRGNNMVVRFRLPSGLEIIGLPSKNFYGGDWDLGPTWNYLVLTDEPFLVDSGRYGQGGNLVSMINAIGLDPKDLGFVLITHGHEDHDGGLAEIVNKTHTQVKAHAIYEMIIRKYPRNAPPGYKENFPAKCWHCGMPEDFFTKHCLDYHQVLQNLEVNIITDEVQELSANIETFHLPGHSPDCLAVKIGDEAILVGDIILSDITPSPTSEAMYDDVAEVIQHVYSRPDEIFGLGRYIKSLRKLGEIAKLHSDILVLPGHRLYYNDRWNEIELGPRVKEMLQHHVDRCAAILEILNRRPETAGDIAQEHFDDRLLEGNGRHMAVGEIISHCELLIKCKDLVPVDGGKYMATGSAHFDKFIFSGV
jgi:glyoxylase-like metal-dependent hydrolase (beta-lactamase superfamily II)